MASTLTYNLPRPIPFADAGTKNTIPTAASPTPGLASYSEGFPPETMLPISALGVPPAGDDFNGIFNDITKRLRWFEAGGYSFFDATLSAATSGYPLGAVLRLSDKRTSVISLVDGNTTDPNSSMTGWAAFGGESGTSVFGGVSTGSANAQVIALPAPLTSYSDGMIVAFIAGFTTTALNATLDAGAGAVYMRSDLQRFISPFPGDIIAGRMYSAIYFSNPPVDLFPGFYITGLLPSQILNSVSGIGTAAATSGPDGLMLGAGVTIIPKFSGNLRITCSGRFYPNATATQQSYIYLGSGQVPSAGDAAALYVASALPIPQTITCGTTDMFPPFFAVTTEIRTLLVGTEYWVDMSYQRTTAGTAGLGYTTILIEEIP